MSYRYRRQGSVPTSSRDLVGSYFSSSKKLNGTYGTGTSTSSTKTYEPYISKYNLGTSYSRPYSESSSKSSYRLSRKYSLTDTNLDYKPAHPIILEPSYSPAQKYSLTRFTDTSPYSTYSSRRGSSSYLSDKDSIKHRNNSISSIDSVSNHSLSRYNQDSLQRDKEIKEQNEPPKQSSYISRIRRKKCDNDEIFNNDTEAESIKYDMILKTNRGTSTTLNSGEDKDTSVISRTRTRRYPKQIIRIEMGDTLLVGNLSQVGKDSSTQTSDEIFIPSTKIRQVLHRSGSSKISMPTPSYYYPKYSQPTRPSWRRHSIESSNRNIPLKNDNVFFDQKFPREKESSPKSIINHKYTPALFQDSIEKVNEWQIANELVEKENSSSRSPVPRSTNYYDLHADSQSHSGGRDFINNDERLVESETLITSNKTPLLTNLSSIDAQNLYVTQFTDLDEFLQDRRKSTLIVTHTFEDQISSLEDLHTMTGESTLVFVSKESREIFNSMSIELQHLILNSKRQKIQFADLLEFCRNVNHTRKFTREEDRAFKVYQSVSELLTELGIDITKLENSVLQLCKFRKTQVEYGPFLDFDLSLHEQHDDLDSFLDGSKVCVVLRTRLAVRVEALIERITNSSGKKLNRALHSLKQIFQDDKDLVQEFVLRQGLHCLRETGVKLEQSNQNYILRALGQLMLYVDGMNAVLGDPKTIEWLYSLLKGETLVVKLAIKLLVVFMEYAKEPPLHASAIISSVEQYHIQNGGDPWSLPMSILAKVDKTESELVTYIMTLINKVLAAVSDQDTFYDVTDWLEEQELRQISAEVLSKSNADVDMVKQFQMYESALQTEDSRNHLLDHKGIGKMLTAKSDGHLNGPRKSKRVKSRRESVVNTTPKDLKTIIDEEEIGFSRRKSAQLSVTQKVDDGGSDVDDIPRLNYQQRRASAAIEMDEIQDSINDSHLSSMKRYKFFKKEKRLELYKTWDNLHNSERVDMSNDERILSATPLSRPQSLSFIENDDSAFLENVRRAVKNNLHDTIGRDRSTYPAIRLGLDSFSSQASNNLEVHRESSNDEENIVATHVQTVGVKPNSDLTKHSVKAMKNNASKFKLAEEIQRQGVPMGDVSGLITTTKDNLQNTFDKPPLLSKYVPAESAKDFKVNFQNESPDWSKLELECVRRPLILKDWDFSELKLSDDEVDSKIQRNSSLTNGVPPPPPPPPPSLSLSPLSPRPPILGPPKSLPSLSLLIEANNSHIESTSAKAPGAGIAKQKRTTRLHWRVHNPAYEDTSLSIWQKMTTVPFEAEKFESLFENKPHDTKKKPEMGPKKIEVLDLKRSNAISIGMTNLPHIPSIKSAILNMNINIINREGVEKLLTNMIPTLEEIESIKNAQYQNKDADLGKAEAFLLELNEVNLLQPRLEVWLFQLDFEQVERDIIESLMDLKLGIKEIYDSKTFVYVISTILTLGNFLNETHVTSFDLNYLEKVSEVKDTKHKHSLLYHVVTIVVKEYPDSTDLHSDLGALNRCHRIDWEELLGKLQKLKIDCKKCLDKLKIIFKSDQTNTDVVTKLKKFYWEASETIVKMIIIHRRIMRRFAKVLEYLGFPTREVDEIKVQRFCSIMSDFAIEYRTTREKILQLEEKKINEKERRKTRGAMIVDMSSLDKRKKEKPSQNNDFVNAVMSSISLSNLNCEMEFNSLSNRRPKRYPQNSVLTDSSKVLSRTSSSNILNNTNMTPATSELLLDQSDKFLDKLAHQATSSDNKQKSTRRSGLKERKSIRQRKPIIDEDVCS